MANFKKISHNIEILEFDQEEGKKKDEVVTWINVNNPGKNELEYLRKKYDFDMKHLRASSGKVVSHRPSLEEGDDYLFMILHFPEIMKSGIKAAETDFFISKNLLITMHNSVITINNVFKNYKNGHDDFVEEDVDSSYFLLAKLLGSLISSAEPILDQNAADIDEVEDIIFKEDQTKSVAKIMDLKRTIISLRKIMRNHKFILEKLASASQDSLPTDRHQFLVLIEKSKRIWQAIDSHNEMIQALHETNESMLNDRISDIMKTLTIFSVIVFPLNLFAAIFGMNTLKGMPFINSDIGFWIIVILMLMASAFMLLIFKVKKWI